MKKGICIVIGVLAAVLLATACLVWLFGASSHVSNDAAAGYISFEKLNGTEPLQVKLPEGRQNLRIALKKGKLRVTLKGGESVLFDDRYAGDAVDVVEVVIPEDGDYTLILEAKRATGTVDYPIAVGSGLTEANGSAPLSPSDG